MSEIGEGWGAALVILAIAFFAHEPWRWLGLYLGRNIDVRSEFFQWVRAVATALVAGLVLRLVLFPAGALADVGLWARVSAFAGGIAIYYLAGRRLAVGVLASAALLILAATITR